MRGYASWWVRQSHVRTAAETHTLASGKANTGLRAKYVRRRADGPRRRAEPSTCGMIDTHSSQIGYKYSLDVARVNPVNFC